jgi:hypothetical protein
MQPARLLLIGRIPEPAKSSLRIRQGEAFGDSRTKGNKPLTTDDYYFFGT